MYSKTNYIIVSGPPGSGKSSTLTRLKHRGIKIIDEPARDIIAEQRQIGGNGVYEKDPSLFINLMLSRATHQFKQFLDYDGPILFDRGIPDMLGYMKLAGLNDTIYSEATNFYRYHTTVLFMPFWDEIYTTDEERQMSADAAKNFGELIYNGYLTHGYSICEVPLTSIEERVKFIEESIKSNIFNE